ncbi:MAG: HEAT repeat domain-containing protein [Phycisphaerales bacterium]|nr:HEAT repeat domain-containing protein [Phycisphaerales bacterium]
MKRNGLVVSLAVAAVLSCAVGAKGQGMSQPDATVQEPAVSLTDEQARALAAGDLTPEQREALRQWNKRRVQAEKVMKTIRFRHFGGKNVAEVRQQGVAELRKVTDPAAFPSMLEVFRDEQADVRKAVCEHLADLNTDQSLTTLAYAAVYERRPEFRQEATRALKGELAGREVVPSGVHTVIASGLDATSGAFRADAARLAVNLNLIEAIPAMIAAQLSPTGGGSGGGYIAYIVVGTQRAYVAFDPIPGVLTEGTILAINDAVAIQYNVGVHDALVGFTSGLSGEDTSKLGWNPRKWQAWYANTLLPKLEQQKAKPEQKTPTTMATPKRAKVQKAPPVAV